MEIKNGTKRLMSISKNSIKILWYKYVMFVGIKIECSDLLENSVTFIEGVMEKYPDFWHVYDYNYIHMYISPRNYPEYCDYDDNWSDCNIPLTGIDLISGTIENLVKIGQELSGKTINPRIYYIHPYNNEEY